MRIISADLIKFEAKILLINKFMTGFMLSLCLIFAPKIRLGMLIKKHVFIIYLFASVKRAN